MLFSVVFLIFGLALSMSAESFTEIVEKGIAEYDLGILEENLPHITEENAKSLGIILDVDSIDEIFDARTLIKGIGKCLISCLKEMVGIIGTACILSVLGFIVRELSSPSPEAARVCEIVSVLSCACLLYKNISFTLGSMKTVLDSLSGYVTAAMPVTLGLISASGRPSLAASSGTLVYTAVSVLGTVLVTFVPTLVNTGFCLASMSAVSDNVAFNGVTASLKKIAVGVMTFIYFVFTGIGGINTIATSGADTLARKSIKYAAGTYIPVAGGYIADGLDVWFASVENLRNSSGIFGIAVVSVTVAVPLCVIASGYFASAVCGTVFSLGGNSSAEKFLGSVKDAYSMMFSMLCGYGIMLCALFAFMMKGI